MEIQSLTDLWVSIVEKIHRTEGSGIPKRGCQNVIHRMGETRVVSPILATNVWSTDMLAGRERLVA